MVYSRYKNIPLQILETERTYVREITTDDVKALYSLYDDEALKYVEPLYEYDEDSEIIFIPKFTVLSNITFKFVKDIILAVDGLTAELTRDAGELLAVLL